MKNGFIFGGIVALIGLVFVAIAGIFGDIELFIQGSSQVRTKTEYVFEGDYSQIIIEDRNLPIYIEESNDDNIQVELFEGDGRDYTIVDGEVLRIEAVDSENWGSFMDMVQFNDFQDAYYLKVYLPANLGDCDVEITGNNSNIDVSGLVNNGSLVINNSNGKVFVDYVSTNSMDITNSNGMVEVSDSTTRFDGKIKNSNGQVIFINTEFDNLEVENDNGKIEADGLYCNTNLDIENNNGKVDISNLNVASILNIGTSNALIEIDDINYGNKATLTTSNGRVDVELEGEVEDYTLDLETSNGKIYVDDVVQENKFKQQNGERLLKVKNSNGEISLDFSGN